MNIVGQQIKTRRNLLGLTQDALCASISTAAKGAWVPTWRDLQRIELGTRIVSDFEVIALAVALEVEVVDLLRGDGSSAKTAVDLAKDVFTPIAQGDHNIPQD